MSAGASFAVYMAEGSVDLLETAYNKIAAKLRAQQGAHVIEYEFQNALLACLYQKQDLLPLQKKDPLCTIYVAQPVAYVNPHYLFALMEETLPGITAAESAGAFLGGAMPPVPPMLPRPVRPAAPAAPAQVPAASAPVPGPAPAPAPAPEFSYPGFSQVFRPGAELAGPDPYPHLAPAPAYHDVPAQPIKPKLFPCSHCKVHSTVAEMTVLTCGHYMHEACVLQ